jgi:uncharacterized protein with NRDE domain
MCLLAIAWRAHPDYPLVVAANRDEFYARPTPAAHYWDDHPRVLAGRDLEAGGSWLGISRDGRFAALTNYRDPANNNPQARSRGQLVSGFLSGDASALDYADFIWQSRAEYNGFNLLLSDGDELIYCGNYAEKIVRLEPGVYALSNALLDTPWPKTVAARNCLRDWLQAPGELVDLASLLMDATPAADTDLPDTGIDYVFEKALSSQFIELEHYGTRSITGLWVDRDGNAEFNEVSIRPEGGSVYRRIEGFWTR